MYNCYFWLPVVALHTLTAPVNHSSFYGLHTRFLSLTRSSLRNRAMDGSFLLAARPELRQKQHPDYRLRFRASTDHVVLILLRPSNARLLLPRLARDVIAVDSPVAIFRHA